MKLHEFTLCHVINEYNDNKNLINAYLNNKSIEGYTDSDSKTISGVSIGIFIFILLIVITLWIWGLVVTIKYWDFIPTWAKVLALIGLLTGIGGPALTLIVVYISKSKKKVK